MTVKEIIEENLRTKNPTLDLADCGITGYEIELQLLKKYEHLQKLNLGSNQILNTSFLKNLAQVRQLYLHHSKVHDISFLKSLPELKELVLTLNPIQDYSFLKNLKKLEYLGLYGNKIYDFSFLQNLVQLRDLDLRSTHIKDVSFLKNLNQLQTLRLDSNQIQDLFFLQDTPQLRNLYLENNEIREFSYLRYLQQLQTLNLRKNGIQDISSLENLPQLKLIDLRYNEIEYIFLEFLNKFPNLEKLAIYGNPIKNVPVEIYNSNENILNIRNFLEDQEKSSSPDKTLKIILIGNGSVGKTQIAKRWTEGKNYVFESEHNSTHAIAFLEKKLGDVTLQLWDFAGQDLYHATHRLFMQTNAIFFLVWDFENENAPYHEWNGKKYVNEKLTYWLEYANHFGQGSPIVVLQNKVDTDAEKQKCIVQTDQENYKKAYPILDFLQVSAKEGKGFKLLEHKLKKVFAENEKLRQQLELELPTSWIKIRTEIQELEAKGSKELDLENFAKLCEKQEVLKSKDTILNYFHDTGVLYYREQYFNNRIIINQEWAITAIYKILDRESEYFEIFENQNGQIFYDDICKIWAENTDAERELFLDFMLSAELAFENTDDENWDTPLEKRTFVVPQLLQAEKSKEVEFEEKQNELKIIEKIEYTFLPKVFIQRFIVKANRFSEVKFMWQKGLFLKAQEGLAVVEADYEKRQILISATSKFVIQKIKEELENISHEGKINPKQKSDLEGLTEKFWKEEFGLDALNPKKEKLNPTIQKALDFISEAKIDEYFEEMDKIEIPDDLKPIYNQFKIEFMKAKDSWNFEQQLRTFTREVNQFQKDI